MANWFRFAGNHSADYGVIVQTFPPLTLPEERAKFEQIPGRSGSLTLLEGEDIYNDIILSVDCYVRDLSTLDQISAWLRGSGDLVLGNQPDRYYKARCINQIEIAKVLRGRQHRTFTAVFRCYPYRYLYPEPTPKTYTASPGSINNPGTADAVPDITVIGSGDIDLIIGDKAIHIDSLAADVTIYGDTGYAFDSTGANLTPSVTFDWPLVIPPGISEVSWTGTVTSVTVTRPWRYI
jgi:predicted phage tail component-like protein